MTCTEGPLNFSNFRENNIAFSFFLVLIYCLSLLSENHISCSLATLRLMNLHTAITFWHFTYLFLSDPYCSMNSMSPLSSKTGIIITSKTSSIMIMIIMIRPWRPPDTPALSTILKPLRPLPTPSLERSIWNQKKMMTVTVVIVVMAMMVISEPLPIWQWQYGDNGDGNNGDEWTPSNFTMTIWR